MFSGGAGAINLFPETCAGRPVPVPLPYLPVEPLPPPPRLAFFPLGPKVMGQIHGTMDGWTDRRCAVSENMNLAWWRYFTHTYI